MALVLITGANGFIGSSTSAYFTSKGYDVIGWDVISSKNVQSIDMREYASVKMHIMETKPDIIIHCAGSADVQKSIQDPMIDYEFNVTITHTLLQVVSEVNDYNPRVLFLSSAGVYGNPQKLPIDEGQNYNPLSPYALHKSMCEQLCLYYSKVCKVDVRIARIFSAYGPGIRKQVFWDMYRKYIEKGELGMFGTGDETRDYIHISDLVRALYLISVCKSNERIFNVANGSGISIRKIAYLFAKGVGLETSKVFFNGICRKGDPLYWEADITKIKDLGYSQSVSIEQGVADYINWVRGENT